MFQNLLVYIVTTYTLTDVKCMQFYMNTKLRMFQSSTL